MSTLNVSKDLAGTWDVTGDEVRINVPFAKVNEERRTVSGFATLDNVDQHDDVVDYEASVKAFKAFRGNIREMHMPVAVGKMVDFQPREFYDEESGETHKGIFVTAYISKGAADTWEKVMDGTLSGFSIAGSIKDKEVKRVGEKYVSIIKDYVLGELSLVDSPANQLANVFAFSKVGDANVVSGMATDVNLLNILVNDEDSDSIVITKEEEREGYTNIGWVESVSGKYDNDEVKKLLTEYKTESSEKSPQEDAGGSEISGLEKDIKGGATVAEENKDEAVEETVEKSTEVETEETVTDEVTEEVEEVEKAADVEETEAPETPVDVDAIVEKVLEKVQAQIAKSTESVEEAPTEEETSDVTKALGKLTETISKFSDKLDEVDARVEGIENSKGVKKSADVVEDDDDSAETEGESFWRGGFLGAGSLTK